MESPTECFVMGCDIHMIAERRSKYDDDSEWEPIVDPIFKNKFYDDKYPIDKWNCPYTFQPYENRNYQLFSILADVRNYHKPKIKPISEPRGYPNDMHQATKWLLDGWDFVDHSPTWLSLDEVFNYKDNPIDSDFMESCLLLKKYGEKENCDIRLVFGFDN